MAVFSLPSIPSRAPPLSSVAELDKMVPLGTGTDAAEEELLAVVLRLETVVSAAPGIPFADTVGMCVSTIVENPLALLSTRKVFVATGLLYFLY